MLLFPQFLKFLIFGERLNKAILVTFQFFEMTHSLLKSSHHNVGNKAKGRIWKRVFQESKACQNFRKTNISYLLIRTRKGVRNVCFSEILACFAFLKHPFWDSLFCLITGDKNGYLDSACFYEDTKYFPVAKNNPFPSWKYLFKINIKNTMLMCWICSELIFEAPERHNWLLSDVFIVDVVQFIVFLSFRLNKCLLGAFSWNVCAH